MNSIETKLHVEIDEEFEKLVDIEPGTDKHKVAVEDIAKLMDRAIEMERLDQAAKDYEMRQKQMEKDERDRLIKNGIAAAGVLIPAVLTVWGTAKSIEFEKTGTFTTIMGRGFIQKLLPKK